MGASLKGWEYPLHHLALPGSRSGKYTMMRFLLIGCIFVMTLAGLRASDVEPLMNVTGGEFNKALETLVKDESAVRRLRASPVTGSTSNQLRQELCREDLQASVESRIAVPNL